MTTTPEFPHPLLRIVSGGQTGVDRAALDSALELGISCGGWCPRGRRAEDGAISDRYPLRETPESDEYAVRTERNVVESDGTVVFCFGERPTGGTALTVEMCQRHGKPCLSVDAGDASNTTDAAAQRIRDFVASDNSPSSHRPSVLNVAGPRASTEPRAYAYVREVIKKFLSMV